MALRNVGYTVVPGINPTNFIYEVKTAAPDLIILGLGAGLEEMLIERVRAESDVMIIALASPARIASGEPPPAEVKTWLPKPIDSRSLLWAVKNLSPQAVRT
jgi:DNA-binding response OmpR family regulator